MLTGNIKSLNIPFYIIEDGDKVETIKDPIAYVICKDGIFLRKSNHIYSAVSKATEISGLGGAKETVEINSSIPKLKHGMMKNIISFFADVYEEHKSEAVVLLYLNMEGSRWGFLVPSQTVSGASAKYDMKKTLFCTDDSEVVSVVPAGYRQMGSIHSHASMSAFHSGTDDKDEFSFDGLHVTVGGLDEKKQSFACRWIAAGQEVKVQLEDIVDTVKSEPKKKNALMELVSKEAFASNFNARGTISCVDTKFFPAENPVKEFRGGYPDMWDETDMNERGGSAGSKSVFFEDSGKYGIKLY
jgi:hypothetical protein